MVHISQWSKVFDECESVSVHLKGTLGIQFCAPVGTCDLSSLSVNGQGVPCSQTGELTAATHEYNNIPPSYYI